MDDCLAFLYRRVISYRTSIASSKGGGEHRNAEWGSARRMWILQTGGRLKDELVEELEMLFHEVAGAHLPFVFKCKRDFNHWQISSSTAAILIGTGDGSTTTFQLRKLYGSGANQKERDITNPISGTVEIYVNGVLQTENTDLTIDYDTGMVTFTGGSPAVPPGNGLAITAKFQFRNRVRFASDDLDENALGPRAKYLSSEFDLLEVLD